MISADDVRLPRDIRVLDVEPSSFEVTLNEIVECDVPVVPQLVGQLPPGLNSGTSPSSLPSCAQSRRRAPRPRRTGSHHVADLPAGTFDERRPLRQDRGAPCFQPVERRWPDVEVRIEVSK